MKQQYLCAESGRLENSQFDSVPIDTVWQVDKLHNFATGEGQTVAVIDSGVNRNDRLPRLFGGGDYIMGGDGLQDCDHHGTLVAGIIAAQRKPGDGFVGIAPGVSVVSIRQASERYQVDSAQTRNARQATEASNVATLARAIVHAAALNATVINISVTACVGVNGGADLREMAGALYFAAAVKDAVVVTSAGNLGGDCAANPGPDPAHPDDPRGWSSVQTLSLPSMFTDFVLSVGGTRLTGDPYVMSMPGPWVTVGAPAVSVVSLDPSTMDGSLVNAQETKDGIEPIAGTSFASANVAGLAALIRQRHPDLSAHQVIERIRRTAHHPSESLAAILGDGVVDPMAALTAPIDDSIPMVGPNVPPVAAVPGEPASPDDHLSRTVALATVGVLAGALFIAVVVAIARGGSKETD
ncbi:type VII secretion-associated serine protease mycosin [Mycobacterium koreense]|uniref:Type VII secretion-associated serine protease mycosin n=2 Tax=Mycolicibacillus koreensis TaxID=1069220 RepID=A0AA91SSG5_9MYCO|nr:type VII secretion-associated serine protease mycosin [Mycolicibacillus koreensis]OSC34798.1 type VII secretion-associated serine protease mycosin [Mycolicibacillus koreensis]